MKCSVYICQGDFENDCLNGTRIVYVDRNPADEGPVVLLSVLLSFLSTLPGKCLLDPGW